MSSMKKPPMAGDSKPTSWEKVGRWYDGIVGDEGHYYHQHIVIPGTLKLLGLTPKAPASLLDLACGQGVLARRIPANIFYRGIDLAPQLIKAAKSASHNPQHEFLIGDVSKPLSLEKNHFSHAALILALQNIEAGEQVIKNAAKHLQPGGIFVIVLNHPYFRIPRQSSWGVDESKKMQYRRIDRYMEKMQIPIQAHPSQGNDSATTWSFHHPLSTYSAWLHGAGFSIELIDEWCSNKTSTGKCAKMENRSREEFPLFMAIQARKVGQMQ